MLLAAEALAERKILLVADTHAHTNGFSWGKVRLAADSTRQTLGRVVKNLGWKEWEIVLSSEIFLSGEFQSVLGSVRHENPYVRAELADILFFESFRGANLKIGWALSGSRNSGELFFDSAARENGSTMSFVYLKPGVTFDPKAPRAPPYFCADARKRVLLDSAENPKRKLDENREGNVGSARNFLKDLARMFDEVAGGVPNGDLGERLSFIIGRCVGDGAR